MARNRKSIIKSLVKGLAVSILFTLLCMVVFAVVLVYLRLPDSLITTLNQIIKIAAVILGVCAAVPRGGEKGLVTGTVLALAYSVLGYILYLSLGGGVFSVRCMLGEMLLTWAAGAVTGSVRANMAPRGRAKAARAC